MLKKNIFHDFLVSDVLDINHKQVVYFVVKNFLEKEMKLLENSKV